MKEKIKENDRKIKYLSETFGNTYYQLLGETIERGTQYKKLLIFVTNG